jgi:1-acyl-sn-glycerol-3-phosphate acyltransferase
VARLALESGAKVVPVALLNTDEIQPTGTLIPKIKPVRLTFGAPLDFSRYANARGDRFVERAITDEIMYELMALSGRPYVDIYAASLKTTIETPTPSPSRRDGVVPEGR